MTGFADRTLYPVAVMGDQDDRKDVTMTGQTAETAETADIIPGVILAGGAGRRMGGVAKGLLALSGRPLLDHVIARFAPQVGALAINTGVALPGSGFAAIPRLPDPPGDRAGPLAGVLAAMDWAAGLGVGRVATVPWDAPFLATDLVARLAGAPGAAMAASRHDGALRLEPVFALWPIAARGALRDWLDKGHRRVADFAITLDATVIEFDAAGFFNVNTPDDLARAAALYHAL